MGDSRTTLRLADRYQAILDQALAKVERDDAFHVVQSQSYFGHVTDVYFAWRQLVDLHRSCVHRIAERNEIDPERLLQSSLLCVALHDLGKLTQNFQDMMRARTKREYMQAVRRNFRHEVAIVELVKFYADRLDPPIDELQRFEVMVIAGHHQYLADSYIFAESAPWTLQTIRWTGAIRDTVRAGVLLAKKMFEDMGWNFPGIFPQEAELSHWLTTDERTAKSPFHQLLCERDRLSIPSSFVRRRELFSLLKGLLMVADWRASAALQRPGMLDLVASTVSVSSSFIEGFVRARVEGAGGTFKGLRPFQSECGGTDGHLIAVAPTGSGKTEAALLWALNQIEAGHTRKVILLLPTMVTANSLHERAKAFFEPHGHEVALVHSTADLVREDGVSGSQSEADASETRSDSLAERHFFCPVTVGTVDQLLATHFHSGRWAMKLFAAADAAIVIDEVHAYDPHTAGLISLLIELLSTVGARFMIMSATMPQQLVETLSRSFPGGEAAPTVIRDQTLLDSARNQWTTCDQPLTEYLTRPSVSGDFEPTDAAKELLASQGPNGRPVTVLVVVNTVQRCQQLAATFRDQEYPVVCYHSKFTFDDRRRLEAVISNPDLRPRLLIATQVVEVALDIDYDILLTECAPIDALIQRAGRVNRRRRNEPGLVVVHPPESFTEKLYDEPQGILAASWNLCCENQGELTERRLIELVEAAYVGRRLEDHADFAEAIATARNQQKLLSAIFDSPRPLDDDKRLATRLVRYQQVSVIPSPFAETALLCSPKDRRRFELKMPVWYAKQHRQPEGRDDLIICKMNYDSFLGGQPLPAQFDGETLDDPSCVIF